MMNAALQNRTVASGVKSEQDDLDHAKAAAAAAAHLNGTSQFYKKMTPSPPKKKTNSVYSSSGRNGDAAEPSKLSVTTESPASSIASGWTAEHQ